MFGRFKRNKDPKDYVKEAMNIYKAFAKEAGVPEEFLPSCLPNEDTQYHLYCTAVDHNLMPADLAVMLSDVGVADAESMVHNKDGQLQAFSDSIDQSREEVEEWAKFRLRSAEAIQTKALELGGKYGAKVALQCGKLGRELSGFTKPHR